MAGPNLYARTVPGAGKVFEEALRPGMPRRICGDVSCRVWGFQLLSVSYGGVLEKAIHRFSGAAAVCVQGAGRDHRSDLSVSSPLRCACRAIESKFSESGAVEIRVSRPFGSIRIERRSSFWSSAQVAESCFLPMHLQNAWNDFWPSCLRDFATQSKCETPSISIRFISTHCGGIAWLMYSTPGAGCLFSLSNCNIERCLPRI